MRRLVVKAEGNGCSSNRVISVSIVDQTHECRGSNLLVHYLRGNLGLRLSGNLGSCIAI
jgi:hypothetical protein